MIEQISFKKGDVFLVQCGSWIKENVIIDVSTSTNCIKTEAEGWITASDFAKKSHGKIGHVEYRGIWPFRKRVTVLD